MGPYCSNNARNRLTILPCLLPAFLKAILECSECLQDPGKSYNQAQSCRAIVIWYAYDILPIDEKQPINENWPCLRSSKDSLCPAMVLQEIPGAPVKLKKLELTL